MSCRSNDVVGGRAKDEGAVTLEIRPVTREEAVDYLRVLPFANGMPWWEPFQSFA